jgi:arylsulfatase A-like enzyme
MDRRTFLTVAAGAPAVLTAAPSHPNVLFVIADEWRAQATGYNGDVNVRTPALDRLASESVHFENAVSGHPVCCPYRASLMSGQYPLTHGIFLNDEEFKPKRETLGQAFAQAGYQTGYIGKWHLYGSPEGKYERRLAYIPPDHRFGFQYWKACECTHDYNRSLYYEDDDPAPKYWPGYDAFAQTDDACRFIEQRSRARDPFLLVLSLGPPHFPLNTAPEKYREAYQKREIRLRPNVPAKLREQAIADLRGYCAHIAAVDDCIARLLSKLQTAGIADRTIVVFTSDHGDMMRSQGLITKHVPWDESIRVPFLLRYPQKLGHKGRRIRTLLNTPDIMPTLLMLAGLAAPAGIQGTDYSKLCAGASPPADSAAFLQFPVSYGQARSQGIGEYRGLRTEQYTYVRSLHGPWLLYDNDTDPYQMHNLCGDPGRTAVQTRLDQALDARLKQYGDNFLPGQEYVARFGYEHNREIRGKPGHSTSPWGDWESTSPLTEPRP